ncbi:SAM-dependent methyltransferase [Halalkaliarchaeum sp. AArc-CO]|uniref:class I SAM-dependent methyltransferase n=1 Tax=unclassified Halalkaliarchaeum TaxID=2678344 RepID=UPI00217E0143|nr:MULTISPECIES: class I SAM-dependent methyltransferase [unclassified Halalkaliarchaeum]MDR5672878.1 class I SAM-dependent methyltransferase [Halalkaliarchaeum sp. AArc-GB]UWG50226.1 SAM-dependent methyltransferase [Halalkaliarchaeum sp. AArc-CO]
MSERSLQETYDRIASHFSSTREYPWPEVTAFLEEHAGGETGGVGSADDTGRKIGLDVGCGNGRHTEPLADYVDLAVGIDVSRGLLEEAHERATDRGFDGASTFLQGDAGRLPIADGTVDVGVYVATLHHLSPRDRRIRSLAELARVLSGDGTALVSAWSTSHDRFDRETGFDTTVDWTLPDGETVPRFYHIYDPEEFRADLEASPLRIVSFELSSGNCYGVVRPE